MIQYRSLLLSVVVLSPVATAFGGIAILEDTRYISVEAFVQRGAESHRDGPYRLDRPEFGRSWAAELTARAEITDAWFERRVHMESVITGAAIDFGGGYGSGSHYIGPRPEVTQLRSYMFADILFEVQAGTEVRISGTTFGTGAVSLTDDAGRVIPLTVAAQTLGEGVYRFRGSAGSLVENDLGVFVFSLRVVPAPASAMLLPGVLVAVRRRR